MKMAVSLALLATFGISQSANAGDSGFYVAADLGTTSVDLNKGSLDNLFAFETDNFLEDISSNLDDSDTGRDVAVGCKFIPYLAVEAAYMNLGGASYKATSIYDEAASIDVEMAGFGASVLGILPFAESFEVFARLGIYFGDAEISGNVTYFEGDTISASDSKSEQELFWGLGAAYNFGESWGVRVEYSQFTNIGDDELTLGESDVERITLGIVYKFY